ncbi:MAG: hypothetical protein JTT11_08095, partial [Candidatus Brockarchaeota archaeon]|nr:hypothetical protein [Candidatus Brockarchaeota archaeon]
MARILPIPERIKLFKEINRVHKETYGWKMMYKNAWYGAGKIDIENDVRLDYHGRWVPMGRSEAGKYYFQNDKGNDITLLRGIFSWQAYYFYRLNPYRIIDYKEELADEDFISDGLGKRIRPDVSRPVHCLETMIKVQQRKDDGKIWISSNWLYHPDCYGSGPGVG